MFCVHGVFGDDLTFREGVNRAYISISISTFEQLPSPEHHEYHVTSHMMASSTLYDAASTDESPKMRNMNITDERLSLPFPVRLPLGVSIAAVTGFTLGAVHGSSELGYRFRAENAHRLPTTQTGWYLYHKSKNYHMMLGGFKEGRKMGMRMAGFTAIFLVVEEASDRLRYRLLEMRGIEVDSESKDVFSSALAGVATAGAFSAWNRFPVPTAVRVAKLGLKAGIGYGILQDALGLLRGRRLGYAEFVKSFLGIGRAEHEKAFD